MHLSFAHSRLWWKEFRQLVPMVVMLLAIAILLHLLFLFAGEDARRVGQLSVFIGLPGLFAVGAGALLVGQEKELKTLHWLSTLPVVSRDVARIKLLVSLLGLGLMWIASLLMITLVTGGDMNSFNRSSVATDRVGEMLSWPLHSLFLLLSGIALAWRFQSSFASLLALVPVAMLPVTFAAVLSVFFMQDYSPSYMESPPAALLIGCQVAFIVGVYWWGRRGAMAALGPAPAARIVAPQARWLAPPATRSGAPLLPFSALVWQASKQNQSILIGCGTLGALAVALSALAIGSNGTYAGWGALGALIGFVASSWLGCSVFQGDRLHHRIRFLADRGIPPRAAWLSRHAVPATLLIGSCFLAAIAFAASLGGDGDLTPRILVGASLLGIAMLIYAVSQWTAHIFSSAIVSAIAGPAISFAAMVYIIFAYNYLGTSPWIFLLCGLLPVLATWAMMRRWMDNRIDRVFWTTQALTVAGFTLIPAIPLLIALATTDSMSRETQQALEMQRSQWSVSYNSDGMPTELVITTDPRYLTESESYSPALPPGAVGKEDVTQLSLREHADATQRSLRSQLANNLSGSVQINLRVLDYLRTELALARLHLNGELSEEERDYAASDYFSLLELATTIVERARLSPRLIDQDNADRLEIALLSELQQTRSADWLDHETQEEIMRPLADRQGRDEARRRALASSWQQFEINSRTPGAQPQFGGYSLPQDVTFNIRQIALRRRTVGKMVELLWDLQAASGDTTDLRAQLAEFWQVPPAFYGIGISGAYARADDLSKYQTETAETYRQAPATQWNADWERQAEELGVRSEE